MEAQAIAVENPFCAADEHYAGLKAKLEDRGAWKLEHSELEDLIEKDGREILRMLLQGHLTLRAQHEEKAGKVDRVVGSDGVARTQRRSGTGRNLMSVFGPERPEGIAYEARGVERLRPMDAALNLPAELYSHGLRRRAVQEVVRGSFDSAVDAVLRSTGAMVPKRQMEELAVHASADFDEFYRTREPVSLLEEALSGPLLVLSCDGKGIAMRHDDLRDATRKAAEATTNKLDKRLSRGEKRHRKRMATVAAVYTLKPYERTSEDIVGDLRGVVDADKKAARPKPENKRVWASVATAPADVIRAAFDEGQRRDPARTKRWIALVDGNKDQIRWLRREAKRRDIQLTIVLDIIHVLEYLWKAAWCFFSEGDPEAQHWVTERLRRILRGEASHVAAGIRRSATKRDLSSEARKGADQCARYLLTYKKYLHYDSYLADGLPIATGVIEGACRHLVRDRMEITGARWSLAGAEAVLRLRALISSGDFDDYWRFHLAHERLVNHRMRYRQEPPVLLPPPPPKPKSRSRVAHLQLVK
jgi:hypothetical protein